MQNYYAGQALTDTVYTGKLVMLRGLKITQRRTWTTCDDRFFLLERTTVQISLQGRLGT